MTAVCWCIACSSTALDGDDAADGSTLTSTGGSGAGGTGGGAMSFCSTGILFAGNPLFSGDSQDTEPSGQDILDPVRAPLRYRNMALVGQRFVVETEFELWSADTRVKPILISRFAGNEAVTETVGSRFEAGLPCAQTQFLAISGMAARPDGTLVVADARAGAVIEITEPGAPNCRSHYVAGTHTEVFEEDIAADGAANAGDVVGRGTDAQFRGLGALAVAPDGTSFVLDEGNAKIKKIATDAERTVSTIASVPAGVLSLAFLNGKLYASGQDGENDFLLRIDPAKTTDNVRDVYRERSHFPGLDASQLAVIASLVSDGEALVAGGRGYIWRIASDGRVLARLAGTGPAFEFPDGFDPKAAHPASEWVLRNGGAGHQWMTFGAGKLYWANDYSVAHHVLRFSCP